MCMPKPDCQIERHRTGRSQRSAAGQLIFVAVLGASSYTYACATATQTACDWVGSIMDSMEFFGGVVKLIVPDQPRALIAQPDRYDPTPGRLLEEMCDHYSVAVLPARPRRPKDKALTSYCTSFRRLDGD